MESSIATRASNYDLPSTATANLIIHHVAKNAEALRAVQGKPLHLSWRARGIFDKTIIVFPVEYQQDHQDNLNACQIQLSYDLSTALCHRRAYGVERQNVYGATCLGSAFSVFAAAWASTSNWRLAIN
jgi:hypothetical protein